MTSRSALIGGVVTLAAWVALAFVMKIPSGWVHLPLAAGCVLIAAAIVLSPVPKDS